MFRMITLRIVIKQIDMADRLDRIIHEACFDADPLFTGPRHFPGSLLDTHGKILGRLGSSGNSSAALPAHSHDRLLDHIIHLKNKLNGLLSEYTGQPLDVICADTERDNYMTAQQAKDYGLVDAVISHR